MQVPDLTAEPDAILRTLDLLIDPGCIVEMRCFHQGLPYGGTFDDIAALAHAAARASDGGCEGVYLLPNPLNLPATNTLRRLGKGACATNKDVARRCVFIVDVDPERPMHHRPNGDAVRANATDDEKALALDRAYQVAAFLSERGLPDPILADSGNGYHLIYRIDLPAKSSLLRDVIYLLANHFSDDAVKVDKAVHNAGRIWKLYGTAVRKGPHSIERPHRLSRMLSVPEGGPLRIPQKRFETLLGLAETEQQSARAFNSPEEEARQVLGFIDWRPDYTDWLKIAWGVVDKVKNVDTAIRLLKQWRPEEQHGEYEQKLKHDSPLERISFGTVVYLARQGGYVSPPGAVTAQAGSTRHDQQLGTPAMPQRAYDRLPPLLQAGCAFFEAWYERDLFLTGALGTLSACLPKLRFRYGRTYHSPHLYLFGIGRAGRGKDAMRQGLRLCEKIVEARRAEYARLIAQWEEHKRTCDDYQRKSKRDRTGEASPVPPGPKPAEPLLKVGEDVTLPALYVCLAANPEGLLMATTEADSLSGAMRREHGGFSPLLRACFHHEPAQKTLKGEGNLFVPHPRLAICVSGTPAQFAPLIDSVENGLFSRFGAYRAYPPLEYRSQLNVSKDLRFEAYLERAQQRVLMLYQALDERRDPLYFDVPDALWKQMDTAFLDLFNRLFTHGSAPDAFAPNVFRGALIGFRLAMILGTLRHFEQEADLTKAQSIEAAPEDIEAARLLALVYVEHSLRQALEMAPELGLLPDLSDVGGRHRMTGEQRAFFDALPTSFTRAEARATWAAQGKADSTGGYWLKRFTSEGLLRKPKTGHYEKARVSVSLERLERLESRPNQAGRAGLSWADALEPSLGAMGAHPGDSNGYRPMLQQGIALNGTRQGAFPKIPALPKAEDLIVFEDDVDPC